MTHCPVCRNENDADSFFCYRCGKYLIEAIEAANLTDTQGGQQPGEEKPRQHALVVLPGGREIVLNGAPLFIERSDFDNTLPQDILLCVSRQHLLIGYENGVYYVQDYGRDGKGSTNHTWLNSIDIHGKGKQSLKNGDKIELSNQTELTLTFKLVEGRD